MFRFNMKIKSPLQVDGLMPTQGNLYRFLVHSHNHYAITVVIKKLYQNLAKEFSLAALVTCCNGLNSEPPACRVQPYAGFLAQRRNYSVTPVVASPGYTAEDVIQMSFGSTLLNKIYMDLRSLFECDDFGSCRCESGLYP